MALLDPHVAVGGGAHDVGRDVDTQQIGEGRLAARVAPGVVARRLERGQERAARLHVGADLAAGLVAQVRGVGDEQRAVPGQRLLRQIILVHEVEHTAPLQQRRVQPLQIIGRLGSVGAAPEGDGALRKQHREIGHRACVAEMRLVSGEPGKELAPRVPPALVLGRATQPVEPRHHAARDRLRHPQRRLGRGLRDVAPHRPAVAVGAGHVGDRAPLHHGAGHATLLRAVPQRRVAGAALVVGVEPAGDVTDAREVFDHADAAAQVAHVDRVGTALPRHRVPQAPHLEQAVHEHLVIATVQRARGVGPLGRHAAHSFAIHLLAALAVAHAERARAGPAVGEERVDRVTPGDLAVDGRHLVGEIGREHAGLEQPGGFAVAARLAVAVALEPLGMRPQRFFPGVVAVHARHHADAAGAGRGRHLAEQVARAQERAAVVIRHLGRVERHDPTAVDEQGVDPQRGPVVDPRRHVEREGITLVEVELSAAAHGGVPRRRRLQRQPRGGTRCGSRGRGQGEELSAIHGRNPPGALSRSTLCQGSRDGEGGPILRQNWMPCSPVRIDYLHEAETL